MFNINGVTWYIQYVPPYSDYLKRTDGTSVVGVCDNESKKIYLSDLLQGSFLRKVICHEVTHAAMFSYNVHLSMDNEELLADLIATYGDEIIKITNKIFKKITSN